MKTTIGAPTQAHRLQTGRGNGCYMKPPGHPFYYTRAVYNLGGNSLDYPGAPMYQLPACDLDEDGARYFAGGVVWLQSLDEAAGYFQPLPEDHDRVRAWVKHVYQHLGRCYDHPTKKEPHEIFVWPDKAAACFALIDEGVFEPKRGDCLACCYKVKAEKYEKAHAAKAAEFARWCVPERHRAVQFVRRYYPKHAPRLDLIARPPRLRGSWYSTAGVWPSAEACPGDEHVNLRHIKGQWCQWCGRD